MNEELKPCPFCGGEADIMYKNSPYDCRGTIYFDVRCTNNSCYLREGAGYLSLDKSDIIERWNVRV